MPDFKYSGKSRDSKTIKGMVSALDKREAARLLKNRGIKVDSLHAGREWLPFTGVPTKDLTSFTRQFSTLVGASLPFDEAISILVEQTSHKRLKAACESILKEVRSGTGLGEAFSKHPKIFNNLYCHLIRAGEAAGVLDTILDRLASHLERMDRLQKKVKAALAYPAVVGMVAIAVIIALMVFVVPTFKNMFEEMGRTLPFVTRLVLAVSAAFKAIIPFLILSLPLLYLLYRKFSSHPKYRLFMAKIMLKLPILGELLRKSAVARFTRTLSTLLENGIPLLDALKITKFSVGNLVIEQAIENAVKAVQVGESFHKPLAESLVFPSMTVRMVAVGEKTGNLPQMLHKVSDYYEEEINSAVDAFMSVLEPIIIVIMGAIIGFVLVAMYLPLFEMVTEVR
ncbi:MAG: hypothetical protein A2293_10255 [Elusimicrobia bacterium RIFOXYB2_FULL_49_7]|nr:MAG: hypothetical protein A2293_10255 [Elusimicrobia bacterium RIFOXYB2_FULL_49_7]